MPLIPNPKETEKNTNWNNFQGFLLDNELNLNESKEEIVKSIKFSSSTDGDKEVATRILDGLGPTYKTFFQQERSAHDCLNGTIFLKDRFSSDEETKLQDRGILRLTPDDVVNRTELYIDSGISLAQNESITWREIVNACLPIKRYNSLIIIDNFAPKGGERNLKELLMNLLPKQIGENDKFYLTIICKGRDNNGGFVYLDHNTKLALTEASIRNHYLSEISYNDRIDITLLYSDYHGKSPFHDRVIITDYSFVIAPGGLDLLREDGTSSNSSFASDLGGRSGEV